MIFKNDPQATEENSTSEPRETSFSLPKLVEPITMVSSPKSKKKTATKSASEKKTAPKTKRGESRTPLSVADLYEKENPFVSTMVEPSYEKSVEDLNSADAKANPKTASDVATSIANQGIPDETLPSVVSNSCRKLRLEDLNAAIDSTENMNVDDPNPDNENMEDSSVHLSLKKAKGQKDVGPDVGTSMDQQAKQDNDVGIIN